MAERLRRFLVLISLSLLLSVIAASVTTFPDEPVKGQEDAPVTIVEYCDFQGPFCKRLEQNAMPKIVENYVATGKAKVVWKDFPLDRLHPWADEAAAAMECVYQQGGGDTFWAVKKKIYDNQDNISTDNVEDKILSWAEQEGLSETDLRGCIAIYEPMEEVKEDKQEGQNLGVSGTPTVFVEDQKIVGANPYLEYKEAIEDALDDGGSYPPSNDSGTGGGGEPIDSGTGGGGGPAAPGSPPEHTIELTPGWNMISVPFATELSSITDNCSLRPYQQYKIWTYNGEDWEHPTKLQNERGYYIYSTESCTATVSGETDVFSGIKLNKGWNMISTDRPLADIKGTCSFQPYQGEAVWRLINGNWQHPSTLSTTGGYFVYAQQDCSLGIPAPTVPSDSTTDNKECERINGFSHHTDSVTLSTFEYVNSQSLSFRVQNTAPNSVTVNRVWFSTNGGNTWTAHRMSAQLANSERSSPQTATGLSMTGCQTLDVVIQYTDHALNRALNTSRQIQSSVP